MEARLRGQVDNYLGSLLTRGPRSTPPHDNQQRGRKQVFVPSAALPARGLHTPVWADMRSPDRPQLETVQQALGFSAEVIPHCLRRCSSPTLLRVGSTHYLVTFLASLSPRFFFSLHKLCICITPQFLLTMHTFSRRFPRVQHVCLPHFRGTYDYSTGHVLRLIMEGTVESYKTVWIELRECYATEAWRFPDQTPHAQAWSQHMQKKGKRFVRFLHQQRSFIHEVERTVGHLLHLDDRTYLGWLELYIGGLARRAGEVLRLREDGGGRSVQNPQNLKVILTETEKQTALIGSVLTFACFPEVDLCGAVFQGANLECAKFVGTALRGANFRGANLRGVKFLFCNVHDADFTGAYLDGADFRLAFGLSYATRAYIHSRGGIV